MRNRSVNDHNMSRRTQVLCSIAILALGCFVFAWMSRSFLDYRLAQRTVLYEAPGELESISSWDGGHRHGVKVRASFRYTVSGVEYQGSRVGFSRNKWNGAVGGAEAERVVSEIEQRSPFFVYVATHDPSLAMLVDERKDFYNTSTIVRGVGAAITILLGLWVLITGLLRKS